MTLSAKERAEKIWNSYMTKEQFIEVCASALDVAYGSGFTDAQLQADEIYSKEILEARAEGFSAAREQAAKIAFEHLEHKVPQERFVVMNESVFEAIRAMKPSDNAL